MLRLFESIAGFDSTLAIQHGLLLDHHRISTTQTLPPCSTAAVML
jgi:hypothetical protein